MPANAERFAEVVLLIKNARQRAYKAVNTIIIDLYWQIGEYVSNKIETDVWGKSTVKELASYIHEARNLDIGKLNA